MNEPPDRDRLRAFFNVTERGLSPVLRDLGLRLIGGRIQWPVVWRALGLAPDQDPAHRAELTAPLMTAEEVARYCGVSARTVYRWRRGELPDHVPPMPAAIDLSGGRRNARKARWRRAEIVAWQNRRPQPAYARPAPVLGALKPTR